MNKSARYDAHGVLKKVLGRGAFLNIALKDVSGLSLQDMALVTRLTNATLVHLNQIDYVLNPLVGGKRVHASVRLILRMAACEIMFLNTSSHAAVFEAVNLVKEIGKPQLSGFVNAVLRRLIETKDDIVYPDPETDMAEYLRVFTGYPDWLIEEFITDYGEEFAYELMTYMPEYGETHVRLNTLMDEPETLLKSANDQGLSIELDGMFEDGAVVSNFVNIGENDSYRNGALTVMGQASMLCVRLAEAKSGMQVLDACAAPGGKTAYFSALMGNSGNITAWDIHAHRVDMTKKNLNRLHCTNVSAEVKDAALYDETLISTFDLVFLDLPCSSLGLAYRKPDVRLFKTKADINALAILQRDIINATKNYVKLGGTLMITTCSMTRDESNLAWFFKKNKAFIEETLDVPKGTEYVKKAHGIQLFPHISKMDGFFICKAKRTI
ncbi:MAG: 16S rRNA (cytosine(967)-C(5))-methyltransferase RsmB [Eubacteriales bacterium]